MVDRIRRALLGVFYIRRLDFSVLLARRPANQQRRLFLLCSLDPLGRTSFYFILLQSTLASRLGIHLLQTTTDLTYFDFAVAVTIPRCWRVQVGSFLFPSLPPPPPPFFFPMDTFLCCPSRNHAISPSFPFEIHPPARFHRRIPHPGHLPRSSLDFSVCLPITPDVFAPAYSPLQPCFVQCSMGLVLLPWRSPFTILAYFAEHGISLMPGSHSLVFPRPGPLFNTHLLPHLLPSFLSFTLRSPAVAVGSFNRQTFQILYLTYCFRFFEFFMILNLIFPACLFKRLRIP